MKTQTETVTLRRELLEAVADFGKLNGFDFAVTQLAPIELFYMGLGALAFANDILQLDRPDNLAIVIEAMKKRNAEATT